MGVHQPGHEHPRPGALAVGGQARRGAYRHDAVSLDEHTRVAQGLGVPETTRDESLCAHAMLEPDLLVVPDLLADDRFADNPATSPPYSIRFYAGVPLVLRDGSRVGTFCVADRRRRVLTPDQVDVLRDLAAQVQRELEPAVASA
jgi:GAF domain-containing protein